MTRKSLLLFSTFLVLMAIAACGGNGTPSSPAAPSAQPPAAAPAQSGATIEGIVSGLAGTSSAGMVGARAVTTVTATVNGVTITATIDGQGKFVLTGVPAGTVTLTFTGTSGTYTLEQVREMERIRIVVTVEGATIRVETQERAAEGKTELEGRISGFYPEGALAADRTGFYIGEILVMVSVPMQHGSTTVTLAELNVGDRVHVRAPVTTGTTITAELVIVQNTNPKVPVNLKGKVAAVLSGTCPAVEFTVSGWTVTTDTATRFQKGLCPDIIAGAGVHVKGDVVSGKVQATWVQFDK